MSFYDLRQDVEPGAPCRRSCSGRPARSDRRCESASRAILIPWSATESLAALRGIVTRMGRPRPNVSAFAEVVAGDHLLEARVRSQRPLTADLDDAAAPSPLRSERLRDVTRELEQRDGLEVQRQLTGGDLGEASRSPSTNRVSRGLSHAQLQRFRDRRGARRHGALRGARQPLHRELKGRERRAKLVRRDRDEPVAQGDVPLRQDPAASTRRAWRAPLEEEATVERQARIVTIVTRPGRKIVRRRAGSKGRRPRPQRE